MRTYSSARAVSSPRATSATRASSVRWASLLLTDAYAGEGNATKATDPTIMTLLRSRGRNGSARTGRPRHANQRPFHLRDEGRSSMRNGKKLVGVGFALLVAAVAALAAVVLGPAKGTASSHREAPLISEDPSADLTDVYAFRSPDRPDTVTIMANVIPAEDPAAGPNWYTFSPTARYNLKVDTNGDARPDVTYRFQFRTKTGPLYLGDTAQPFTVSRSIRAAEPDVIARGTTPPNNIGPRSTPNYHSLVTKSIVSFDGGASKAFAGQRDDPFFGDIGAIFDLVAIRKGTGNMGGGRDF